MTLSIVRSRRLHWAWTKVLSGAACALLASTVAAQAPATSDDDILGQARRRQEVATQKMEADVRDGLQDARKLGTTDPAAAVEKLKKLLSKVEDDDLLSNDRRESLKRTIKERIRVLQLPAPRPSAADTQREEQKARIISRRADDERQQMEQFRIAQEMMNIRGLEREGRHEEAGRMTRELAQKYPTSPALQASRQTAAITESALASKRLDGERSKALIGTIRDVDKSGIAPNNDMNYPKDWNERTKGRSSQIALSNKEKEILRALNTPLSVELRGKRLEEVIDYLQDRTKLPIIVDKLAMDEANITYDNLVNVNLKGVTLRTLLRKIFSEYNMTYVIQDEALFITSAAKARDMMVVRSYYVADLAVSMTPIVGNWAPAPWLPTVDQVKTAQNIQGLIDIITSSVEPGSWAGKGSNGGGTIIFNPATMSLVIKQSAEVHAMIGGGSLK